MIPMMVFSMAMQAAKAGNQSGDASKLNNMSNAINPQDPTYKTSPYAQQRLGLAENLLNARMPGATSMERSIYGNQANQMANVNRNATSGSQGLAMGAAAQGQTNQAMQNLGTQEQQDYYNRLQNLTGAQQGMTQEGDKVYQDQLRDYQEKMQLKNAYLGAAMQNKNTALNSWANVGTTGAGMMSNVPSNAFAKKGPDGQPLPNSQQGGLWGTIGKLFGGGGPPIGGQPGSAGLGSQFDQDPTMGGGGMFGSMGY